MPSFSCWFSPSASEISTSRLSLDFDLRAADLFFRELVAPGLGRIWFARQISWPLAAIALHEELTNDGWNAPKPTTISHGIEALGCKLENLGRRGRADRSRRLLGSRAFARDDSQNVWSFGLLSQAKNYVRNTHRQASTRALRTEGGLGFAQGSRFDLLELEPIGRELARAFLDQHVGQGGKSLRNWLLDWIQGDEKRNVQAARGSASIKTALSPERPTNEERAIVRARLLDTSNAESDKRLRLSRAIGNNQELPDIEDGIVVRLREAGYPSQANEILAARGFGAVLDRARDAVAAMTKALDSERLGLALPILAQDEQVEQSTADLRAAATNYLQATDTAAVNEPYSRRFAEDIRDAENPRILEVLVQRAEGLFALADRIVVWGSSPQIVKPTQDEEGAQDVADLEDGALSLEPDRTGRTFRIKNLHSLLRDVRPQRQG